MESVANDMNGNSKRIKVAMVFSSAFNGMGICHNVFNYCKYINESRFELQFFMINEPPAYFKDIMLSRGWKYTVLDMRNSRQLKYIIKLSKLLKKDKVDILHAHGNSATLALEMMAGILGHVHVRIAHSRNSGCTHMVADKILRPFFNRSYTIGMAVSKEAGEWLFGNRPYTILKNANDILKFRFNESARSKMRSFLNLSEDEVAIGHVGTFGERKNQNFAIDIFSLLCKRGERKYRLFFVGGGEGIDIIKEKVRKLSLEDRVTFMGLIDYMPDFLQGMDIMLLPSLYEGLPNTLIEWQAAGLPSVVSDTVTNEAKVTGLPIYLPLNKGADEWEKVIDKLPIIDRTVSSEVIINEISAAGFDVRKNVIKLEEIYQSHLQAVRQGLRN